MPKDIVEKSVSVDRVIHNKGAVSPGKIGSVERPWYMHYHQKDNLLVLHGYRNVELYSRELKRKVVFKIFPDKIYRDGELLAEEGVVLSWGFNIFHRIISGEDGSASLNFAIREDGFDVKTNFNIYKLNEDTGDFTSIREGYKDQF